MRIILDATGERLYPIAKEGFTSGTVQMIRHLAAGLAERGHTVHVIANDAEQEEQRRPNLWYWPAAYHPTKADAAVQLMHVNPDADYDAELLLLATYGCDPYLGPEHQWAAQVDAFPVFSQVHADLMRGLRPTIAAEKCHVTGLGVDVAEYTMPEVCYPSGSLAPTAQEAWRTSLKVPGRLLYANDPARGLFHLLDVFDKLKAKVPGATLHVAYDFERNLQARAWEHSLMAQQLWECKRRIEATPGVVSLGSLSREQVVREQLECQVHAMPSDPPNVGTQIHGITQMECAAAGCALVLSDVEAFPEVFGEGATILPIPGKYEPSLERRYDAADWAEVIAELMQDSAKWQGASRKARALAERHTWGAVIGRWETMLAGLKGETVDE